MRSRLSRTAFAGAFALVAVFGMTACQGANCPAIGWNDTLTVELTDKQDRITALELCFRGHCMSDDDLGDSPLAGVQATDLGNGTWQFDMGMWTPAAVLLRGLASDGTVANEYPIEPDWSVTDEVAPGCGGPATATVEMEF